MSHSFKGRTKDNLLISPSSLIVSNYVLWSSHIRQPPTQFEMCCCLEYLSTFILRAHAILSPYMPSDQGLCVNHEVLHYSNY